MRHWMIGLALMIAQQGPARAAAPAVAPSPAAIGRLAANAYLDTPQLMMYRQEKVVGVHYADAAAAYGAIRLARAIRDNTLLARVAARHRQLLAEAIPNSRNHVDVNLYGLWPLALAARDGDPADRARGLEMADGQWREVGPDGLTRQARYWIDDIWMIGALQIEAWRVTRDSKYLDRAALMARLYIARLQEPNGLFHHGPDAPFFWARGNGWVAAGLGEILSELPKTHPDYPVIVAGYRRMMAALLTTQADDGMWRQLIDHSEAWKETSATAMFGFAMVQGVRRGILADPAYRRAYRRAWAALSTYVRPDGKVREVCAGTGQSRDAAYYLTRPRIVGDFHGQAPLMWFAAVLAEEQSATPSPRRWGSIGSSARQKHGHSNYGFPPARE